MSRFAKVLKTIIAVALSTMFILTMFGCSGEKTPTSEDLVGTWQEKQNDISYVFKDDGTGVSSMHGEDVDITWKLTGNTLALDFPETGVEEYEITYTGKTFTLNDAIVTGNIHISFEFQRQ